MSSSPHPSPKNMPPSPRPSPQNMPPSPRSTPKNMPPSPRPSPQNMPPSPRPSPKNIPPFPRLPYPKNKRSIPGVAVVTGMARRAGIGHAICNTLLSEVGMSVIGIDIQPLESCSPLRHWNWEQQKKTTNNEDETSSRAVFCSRVATVLDHEQVYHAVSSGLREIGKECITVVVNNAGTLEPYMQTPSVGDRTREVEDLAILTKRLEEYDSYIQINLRSAFLVTEVCRKWFPSPSPSSPPSTTENQHDSPNVSIIHISSTRAHQSERDAPQEGYASAKSGLIGLMHAQGQSDLSKIARVNVISPGRINTGDVPTESECEWHACGRIGRPRDVASLVAFLVDDDKSGFVSCEEFVLDGGVSRRMYYPE